jgi:hypothetical protein
MQFENRFPGIRPGSRKIQGNSLIEAFAVGIPESGKERFTRRGFFSEEGCEQAFNLWA